MNHQSAALTDKALPRLRWLFTALGLLSVYFFVYALWRFRDPSHSRVIDQGVHVLLTCGAAGFAWRRSWRAFILLGLISQALSAFGCLINLGILVLSPEPRVFGELGVTVWNLGGVALNTSVAAYLARAFPPEIEPRLGATSAGGEMRLLTAGFLLASGLSVVDIAPSLWTNIVDYHLYGSHWILGQTLIAALMVAACFYGLRSKSQTFVSLGLISQALSAMVSFHILASTLSDTLWLEYDPLWRRVIDRVPLFAFSLFMLVYLTRRFPPSLPVSTEPSGG